MHLPIGLAFSLHACNRQHAVRVICFNLFLEILIMGKVWRWLKGLSEPKLKIAFRYAGKDICSSIIPRFNLSRKHGQPIVELWNTLYFAYVFGVYCYHYIFGVVEYCNSRLFFEIASQQNYLFELASHDFFFSIKQV